MIFVESSNFTTVAPPRPSFPSGSSSEPVYCLRHHESISTVVPVTVVVHQRHCGCPPQSSVSSTSHSRLIRPLHCVFGLPPLLWVTGTLKQSFPSLFVVLSSYEALWYPVCSRNKCTGTLFKGPQLVFTHHHFETVQEYLGHTV